VITLTGRARGQQALKAHQHTLFKHLKSEFFCRNLGQSMPKNTYFFRKDL